MLPKSILFYWSKGAGMRREIIKIVGRCKNNNKPCFLNLIARKLKMSHVAVKKHLDLLIGEGYIKQINPNGKPVYLQLRKKGKDVLEEFTKD